MEAAQQPALDRGKKPSVFGILTSPEEQFRRINQNPTFWGPFIIFTILVTLLVVAQAYVMISDPSYEQTLLEQTKGQPIDLEFTKMVTMVMAGVTGLFTVPIMSLLSSLISWVMVIIFQGETTFKKMFSMSVHLLILSILSLSMTLLYSFVTGNIEAVSPTSLAAFISAEGILKGILSSIDVITLWGVALTAMGLRIVGELSKGKAWTISLIFYGVGILFSVLGIVFQDMAKM